MIDLKYETPQSLAAIAALLDCHVSTVHRWTTKGLHGRVLETLSIGGRRYTTIEALQRFSGIAGATSAGHTNEAMKATKELERYGI